MSSRSETKPRQVHDEAFIKPLYMPAVVAARHNPDKKRFYERLIKARKPAKVAFTAIMRKLILLANTLIKQDRMWAQIKA